jgi:hypothetical protein
MNLAHFWKKVLIFIVTSKFSNKTDVFGSSVKLSKNKPTYDNQNLYNFIIF